MRALRYSTSVFTFDLTTLSRMPQLPTTKGEPLAVPSLPLPATPRPALQLLFPTGNETSGNPDEESAS